MAQHTPGPWHVAGSDRGHIEDRRSLPILGGFIGGKSLDEMQANVRLAAAAPDLLEALEQVVRMDDGGKGCGVSLIRADWDAAAAAIAKAKGE